MVFLFDRLAPRDREKFRAAFEDALGSLPPPPSGSSTDLESLHRIWNRARRKAFSLFLEELEKHGPAG